METVSKIVLALALLSSVTASSVRENEVFDPARQPRTGGIIKSLLPFINFKIKNPFECRPGSSVSGNPVLGTCMSQQDCDDARGQVDGECAAGYGKCCILYANCGDTITRNRTYIISNSTTSTSCTYTISKEVFDFKTTNEVAEAIGACQVRLDFEEFVLGAPDDTSLCTDDSFEITGNRNAFGKICGNNEDQHVYLPISSDSDTIATITILKTASTTGNWRIRTTYIPCLSNMTAPPGCLQYFTEDTGEIKSFNFGGPASPASVTQIGGLEYSACISEKTDSCGVSITANSFLVSGAVGAVGTGLGTVATCGATDYIAVTEADNTGLVTDTIFCGGAIINSPIETYAKPFTIYVRTNDEEPAADTENAGFSLAYSRLSC